MAIVAEQKMTHNAFAEMKRMLKKGMKEQGLTVADVRASLKEEDSTEN